MASKPTLVGLGICRIIATNGAEGLGAKAGGVRQMNRISSKKVNRILIGKRIEQILPPCYRMRMITVIYYLRRPSISEVSGMLIPPALRHS